MTPKPVAVSVSQATRLKGSCAKHASRIASEIWSAILSGCPSVTDSLVNKKRSRFAKSTPPLRLIQFSQQPCNFTLVNHLLQNPSPLRREPALETRNPASVGDSQIM